MENKKEDKAQELISVIKFIIAVIGLGFAIYVLLK